MTDYRLTYHLAPRQGWLNDPNGLCVHNGKIQIYYQADPDSPVSYTHLDVYKRQGQILADSGDHVLSEFRFVSIDPQVCQLIAIADFGYGCVGDVHQIAHDVFLGVFSFQTLVADNVEVQFGDDADVYKRQP